jgi:hypothetical protein
VSCWIVAHGASMLVVGSWASFVTGPAGPPRRRFVEPFLPRVFCVSLCFCERPPLHVHRPPRATTPCSLPPLPRQESPPPGVPPSTYTLLCRSSHQKLHPSSLDYLGVITHRPPDFLSSTLSHAVSYHLASHLPAPRTRFHPVLPLCDAWHRPLVAVAATALPRIVWSLLHTLPDPRYMLPHHSCAM